MGLRYESVAAGRSFASVTDQTIGQSIICKRIAASALGGFYCKPFQLPQDFDPTKPIDVAVLIHTAVNSGVDGQHVRLRVNWTEAIEGVLNDVHTITYDWPVPNGWLTSNPLVVLIDNGNGHTFDAHQFSNTSTLGLRIDRNGIATEDTYAQATDLAEAIRLTYSTKFPWLPVQI